MVKVAVKKSVELTGIPIVDEANTWNKEQNIPIQQWQMDELDRTDEKIKSGKIKYYNSQEFDSQMFEYIKNLYSKKSNSAL